MKISSSLPVSSTYEMGLILVTAFVFLISNFTIIISAQQQQQLIGQPAQIDNGIDAGSALFQSTNDSFSVQVPEGWIINDLNNTGSGLKEETRQGYGMLAQLCPEEGQQQSQAASSLLDSGDNTNTNSCQEADEVIFIIRYPNLGNLGTVSLLANNATTSSNNVTTTDNILTYHLRKLQEVGYIRMQIIGSADMTLNLTNPHTYETISAVPAKAVELRYSNNDAPDETKRGYFILTATNDTAPNLGITKGYTIFYESNSTTNTVPSEITTTSATGDSFAPPTPLPSTVWQIFDSFELIAANGTTNPATMSALQPSPFQQQIQQQEGGELAQSAAESGGEETAISCHPSYPDICISPVPPDLNCTDEGIPENFRVNGSDPHMFDEDNDGIGCESASDTPDDSEGEVDDGADDDAGDVGDVDSTEEPEPGPEPGVDDDSGAADEDGA